jgi:hypothetical protein
MQVVSVLGVHFMQRPVLIPCNCGGLVSLPRARRLCSNQYYQTTPPHPITPPTPIFCRRAFSKRQLHSQWKVNTHQAGARDCEALSTELGLRFYIWGLLSSWIWRRVGLKLSANVSQDSCAFVFNTLNIEAAVSSETLVPTRATTDWPIVPAPYDGWWS